MAREAAAPNVQVDDSENNQFENALGVVISSQVLAPVPLPPTDLPNLQLDLIANSSYRRPPPAAQS